LTRRVYRWLLFSLGAIATTLGFLGIVLPLLPATPFFLLAAWCFYRSSPPAHDWLHRQPVIGPALDQWQRTGSIAPRVKFVSVTMILVSVIFVFKAPIPLPGRVVLMSCMAAVVAFIVTRPNR
jgi:uncharacterized membrane protein YbaN (DUF454 family)